MLAKIEEFSTAIDIMKSVTILRWVAHGWERVSSLIIHKCFRKAGILDSDFAVVTRPNQIESDPFEDLDLSRL